MTPSLKEVVAALDVKVNRRGYRQFTTEAKAKACRFAILAIANGASTSAVSNQLGLKGWTLQRWLQNARHEKKAEAPAAPSTPAPAPARGFHRVVVKDAPKTTMPTVCGPFDVRVEGLSIEATAELLRRLWCSA